MRFIFLFLLFIQSLIIAQVNFDKHFLDKTLRFDYLRSGNYEEDFITFDEMIEEPIWGGSKINLIDTIRYGNFFFEIINIHTDSVIYSRGYSTLFDEWQTTAEAKKIQKSFNESLVFPYPKGKVRLVIYERDNQNKFVPEFEYLIDPENYFIKEEQRLKFENFQVHYSGEPSKKLDILFIPDGYTKSEMPQFKEACRRFAEYLFKYSPFSEMKEKINIWGVEAYSKDSGTDIPAKDLWKNTVVNSTFYTFDSERYLMTEDYKSVRDVAANAPYDQIIILVNTAKYGGGAIYNFYSTFAANNEKAEKIFIHELGHGLAGLADEYYTDDVSYVNFYNLEVEPWEPNITTLIDFESKWQNLIAENTPIPTPQIDKYSDVIGVFEGAGYIQKGIYRSS